MSGWPTTNPRTPVAFAGCNSENEASGGFTRGLERVIGVVLSDSGGEAGVVGSPTGFGSGAGVAVRATLPAFGPSLCLLKRTSEGNGCAGAAVEDEPKLKDDADSGEPERARPRGFAGAARGTDGGVLSFGVKH